MDKQTFYRRVREPDDPDACHEWVGGKTGSGYGALKVGGRQCLAHRVSYRLHHGPIRDGLFVLHSCDRPECVNPRHLHLGTQAQNMREMVRRGRSPKMQGERNGHAILDADDVQAIRKRYKEGERVVAMSREYGVHVQTIYSLLSRQSWRHI